MFNRIDIRYIVVNYYLPIIRNHSHAKLKLGVVLCKLVAREVAEIIRLLVIPRPILNTEISGKFSESVTQGSKLSRIPPSISDRDVLSGLVPVVTSLFRCIVAVRRCTQAIFVPLVFPFAPQFPSIYWCSLPISGQLS